MSHTNEELLALFVDKNNISKLLIAWGSLVQDHEDAAQQVLTQRTLATAVGHQLDVIGAIVTQPRNGLNDSTYRRYCSADIAAHLSTGTVASIIKVMSLIFAAENATYEVVQQPIATVLIAVETPITTELAVIALSFLQRTAAAGVRVVLDYGVSDPATWFQYDSGPGYDVGHYIGSVE